MDSEDAFIFCHDALPSTCFPAFEIMRQNGEYCDLIVNVGEKSVSTHRIVIAANIPYFQSILSKGARDCQQITVQEMDPDAVESLIEYAYSGQVKITPTNVTSLLSSSKHLQVDVVRDACCEFLGKRLHPNNVLRTRELADRMGCSGLVKIANCYVREHFDEVSLSEEFLELPFMYIKLLICRDDLCAASEEKIFEAALNWIKKVPAERKIKLPELLSDIRMPLISLRYLSDHVAKEQLIQESMMCRDLVDDAKNYHQFAEKMTQLCKFTSHPRCIKDHSATATYSSVSGIYALCDSPTTGRTVQRFDPKAEKWHVIGTGTDGLYRDAVLVAMGYKLYVFGGRMSSYVRVFDLKTRFWTAISPMQEAGYGAGAASLDEKLYVCGGYDCLGSLSRVECYDQESNTWANMKIMLTRRHAAAVVTMGKYIYVLGGIEDSTFLKSAERFDPKTSNKGTAIASMEVPRAGFGAAAMNGRIYACGGWSGSWDLSSCEVYDPVIDKWHFISELKIKRHNLSAVSHCGKLYAFGSSNHSQRLKTYEIYDSENNQWNLRDAIFPMVNFLGVVATNNL